MDGTLNKGRGVYSCISNSYDEFFDFMLKLSRHSDGELSQHKNTRVLSGPRYELRKRPHSQQQQNNILLLIHKFEKLTIHEMNEEDLSKAVKESVDPKGIIFPPSPFMY